MSLVSLLFICPSDTLIKLFNIRYYLNWFYTFCFNTVLHFSISNFPLVPSQLVYCCALKFKWIIYITELVPISVNRVKNNGGWMRNEVEEMRRMLASLRLELFQWRGAAVLKGVLSGWNDEWFDSTRPFNRPSFKWVNEREKNAANSPLPWDTGTVTEMPDLAQVHQIDKKLTKNAFFQKDNQICQWPKKK